MRERIPIDSVRKDFTRTRRHCTTRFRLVETMSSSCCSIVARAPTSRTQSLRVRPWTGPFTASVPRSPMNCAVEARLHALSTRRLGFAVGLAVGATGCVRAAITPPASVVTAADRFESEIRAFEDSDRINRPRPGGIVFVGSSSIRLWPDLRADFPGLNVIQRGFGGSRLDEVVRYTPRIVLPYRPALIVLYAGENDIAEDRTPEQVFDAYKAFVRLVRDTLPQTPIAFVSIKPSPSRWQLVDKMRVTNEMIRSYTATHPGQSFVDVFSLMIGPNGRPRSELFVSDSLHMNHKGYAIWRSVLSPIVSSAPTL